MTPGGAEVGVEAGDEPDATVASTGRISGIAEEIGSGSLQAGQRFSAWPPASATSPFQPHRHAMLLLMRTDCPWSDES